jgi:hypothetical protein
LQDLLSPEGEQLPGDRRRALRGVDDLLDVRAQLISRLELLQQQVALRRP